MAHETSEPAAGSGIGPSTAPPDDRFATRAAPIDLSPSGPRPGRHAHGTAGIGSDPITAAIAVLGGAVDLISLASVAVFFAVGGPFGAISDWTTGLLGFLTGLLAVRQGRRDSIGWNAPRIIPIVLAVSGAAIVVVGSGLVISDATGFLLAGLVESVGFALIGVWLIWLNWSMRSDPHRPRRLSGLGMIAGAVMAMGFILVPGVATGLDDAATAPGGVWIGFLSWVGVYFLYATWSLWFGLRLTSPGPAKRGFGRTIIGGSDELAR